MINVTLLIPIGPNYNPEWLQEAVDSVLAQTVLPQEILLVDDTSVDEDIDLWNLLPVSGHNCGDYAVTTYYLTGYEIELNYYKNPWNIGFAQSFNCGVGLADNELIMYLAADDKLMPTAIEDCIETWEANKQKDAWYAMSYQVGDDVHTIPINAAMITRRLWKWVGGFPPSAFAGPDALILSILLKHAPDRIIKVKEKKPLYWIRTHAGQETHRQASYFLDEMNSIRNKETERFVPNSEVTLR